MTTRIDVWLIAGMTALLAVACSGEDQSSAPGFDAGGGDVGTTALLPGRFSITRMGGASAPPAPPPPDTGGDDVDGAAPESGIPPAEPSTLAFDMGDLKGSDDFLFLLKNTGDLPITNVVLTTDDPAFEVAPTQFALLEPDKTSSVAMVLRVRANHGTALSGVGPLPVLPKGLNHARISMTGDTTTSGGVATQVSQEMVISVNALVADFEIYKGDTLVDLAQPTGGSQGICVNYIAVPPKLRNTGNVPLVVRTVDINNLMADPTATETVLPDDYTTGLLLGSDRIAVWIDSGGVTFETSKYKLPQGALGGAMVVCLGPF